jgi:hypothetical protein
MIKISINLERKEFSQQLIDILFKILILYIFLIQQ